MTDCEDLVLDSPGLVSKSFDLIFFYLFNLILGSLESSATMLVGGLWFIAKVT